MTDRLYQSADLVLDLGRIVGFEVDQLDRQFADVMFAGGGVLKFNVNHHPDLIGSWKTWVILASPRLTAVEQAALDAL